MFAQPWAWLGLLGLAVPIAVHLLARHQAVRARFPTLRFIDVNELSAIRRHRLTDIPLLLVRLAIIALAVAALAGPRWPWGASSGGPIALAVIVDTSAGVAGDAGPMAAREAVAGVATATIIQAESLTAGLRAAAAWLAQHQGPRAVQVISDFQTGSLDAAALAVLPADVGVRFTTLPMFAPKTLDGFSLRDDRSRMAWGVAPAGVPLPLTVRAGEAQPRADAMLAAVASLVTTAPVDATARRAVVVFRAAPDFATLAAAAAPINQPWMFEATRSVANDVALRSRVTLTLAGTELAVLVDDEPDSVVAADVTASLLGALLQPLPWSEFEPTTIAPDTLRGWERAPAEAPARNALEPQGRWLWLVVVLLLGIEWWMRRRTSEVPVTSADAEARAHVA